MSSDAVILKNISYKFKNNAVLEDINLKIKKNDFLAIIGPNGGGKSTLLKIIMGIYKPYSGSVRVFNTSPEEARPKIGYLPQITHLESDFPISVFDAVIMGCYHGPLKGYTHQDEKDVIKSLKVVKMEDFADKQIGNLSGGQLQRVLIARALARRPKLLLLDEPTASIDPEMQNLFYDLLKKIRDEMAVVLVSHDVGVISSYVESIACLNRRLFSHGPVKTAEDGIKEAYKFQVNMITHETPQRILKKH
ncbi:MAG: metal ABC transporter ATP-binding protein [Methanobacteriaceae archaeon]|nr:metal ABC transporter ATP-binding protein [Methanobacteriaceae archaeon]